MGFVAEPATQLATYLERDFRISSKYVLGTGSLVQKAAANLEAIRLLKQIEGESRLANEDEKAILVRYTGWGALPQVFHPCVPAEWRSAASELESLLTDAEYQAARASTPNAHYTSSAVIEAIWNALLHFGVIAPAKVLEPALGIGHFFGFMPEQLARNTVRVGIELDSISARIAQLLYPDSTIREAGFETASLPNSFFDVVVGNVPFGNYPVYDPQYAKQTSLTRSIHDYFVVKSVDLVRPGGLIALITSRYTLDKQSNSVRQHLASRANLIAAIRLPNTTFKANAGPDHPLLLSLEEYDPETKRATKTKVFHERTIEGYKPVEHVDTAAEALVVSLNETGQLDWPRMALLAGKSIPALQAELTGLVFRNPEGNTWETADAYLSGNVRQKLHAAEAAAAVSPEFASNVEALRAIQPPDLEPGDIDARLGSPWIPVSDIRSFVCELLSTEEKDVTVSHAESIASWTVELGYGPKYAAANTTTYGTARFTASTLIEQALNNRTPTAYDEVTAPNGEKRLVVNQNETLAGRERQQELKEHFQK